MDTLQRLTVSSYISIPIVHDILQMSSNLKYLSIQNNLIELFEHIGDVQMQHIQILEIGEESNENNDWSIVQLQSIFPFIERLDIRCQ
jgi:hypothetical protein